MLAETVSPCPGLFGVVVYFEAVVSESDPKPCGPTGGLTRLVIYISRFLQGFCKIVSCLLRTPGETATRSDQEFFLQSRAERTELAPQKSLPESHKSSCSFPDAHQLRGVLRMAD